MKNKKVTLMVNECSEFHGLGESHENIETVDEAIRLWKRIPKERLNGIKSIGIRVEDESNPTDATEFDVLYGNHFDFDMIHYYPDILESEKAIAFINELREKLPDMHMIGTVPEQLMKESQEDNQVVRNRRHR